MSGLRVLRDDGASFFGMVGEHPTMLTLFDGIRRAAALDAPIVVSGPTGSGRELVAGALHALSGLKGPFRAVSIAELPEALMESELFGSIKGAFTGAVNRPGLVEAAAHGTLFLDEGGDLPRAVQAKLLRALETGAVRRVGDHAAVRVPFRLIVAVREEPGALLRSGTWRDDFYYRVTGIVVRVPPLAARRSDIPLLARAYVRAAGLPELEPGVTAVLADHGWPGNVRELQRALVRAAHHSCSGRISAAAVRAALAQANDDPCRDRGRSLVAAVARHVRQTLDACGGDARRAALLLGISRAHVYRLLRRAGPEGGPRRSLLGETGGLADETGPPRSGDADRA